MIHFTLRMIVILIETIKDLYQTRLAKDGGTVRTIRGGCDYMTGMGKQRELRSHWQRVCKLILAKTDVVAVSRALELALAPRSRMALARFRRKTAQVTAHSPARGSALIEISEAVRVGVTPLACVSCDTSCFAGAVTLVVFTSGGSSNRHKCQG